MSPATDEPSRVVVLASGSGSNLQALLDTRSPDWSVVAVISDRPGAMALERAMAHGIPTGVVKWIDHEDRNEFTEAITDMADGFAPDLVVLAGFMRILGPAAIARFRDRIINVHPSLLPAYPGANAVGDTLASGASVSGATVHFVDELLDHGPVIRQESVPVLPGDDLATLHARIQEVEHDLLPRVVQDLTTGKVRLVDGDVKGAVTA